MSYALTFCSEPNEESGQGIFSFLFNQSPNPSCNAASCHNNAPMAEFPPTSGHHSKHLSNPNMDHTSGVCFNCHRDYYYNSQHRNGNLEGYDTIADVRTTGLVAYFGGNFGADSSSPVSAAFDPGTATCNTVSCHGGGSGFNWYQNLPADNAKDCKACHMSRGSGINPVNTNGNGKDGKHVAHVQRQNIDCTICHKDYRSKPGHMNRKYGHSGPEPETEQFAFFGGTWPIPSKPVSVNFNNDDKTCSSISCHGGSSAVFDWYDPSTNGCIACHASGAPIDPVTTNGSGTAGKHIAHVQKRGIECMTCHNGHTTTPDHMDGQYGQSGSPPEDLTTIFINFNQTAEYPSGSGKLVVNPPGTPVWTNASNTCSSISCHGGSPTNFDWYSASSPACTDCHASGSNIDPVTTGGSLDSGKHIAHVVNKGISCTTCHFQYNSTDDHMDGQYGRSGLPSEEIGTVLINFNPTAEFPSGSGNLVVNPPGTPVWSNTDKTCSSIACHGGTTATAKWYDPSASSCTACHASGSSIDPMTTNGSGNAGKHIAHVNKRGIECTTCHKDHKSTADHMDGEYGKSGSPAEPGATNYVNFTSTVIFPAGSGKTVGTPNWDNTANTCNTINCHGGSATNFNWYAADGTTTCTDCHSATSTINPVSTNGSGVAGKHVPHVQNKGIACTTCHLDHNLTANHIDGQYGKSGSPAEDASTDYVNFNAAATFNGVTVGTPNWSNAANTCNTIDCHGGSSTSFNWYSATSPPSCTDCHSASSTINPLTTGGSGSTGKHIKHVTDRGVACTTCHLNHYSSSDHMDGQYGQNGSPSEPNTTLFVTANPSATYGSTSVSFSFETATNTCNSLSCHGGGSGFDWYASLSGCTSCHNSGNPNIDPTNTTTFPVNSHPKHVSTLGYACTECHTNYNNESTHMNGSFTPATLNANKIKFDTSNNPSGTYNTTSATYDGSGKVTAGGNCNSLMCHGNNLDAAAKGTNNTPTWGTAATGACGTCHKTDTNGQGSHTKHLSAPYSFACDKCHYDAGTDANHHQSFKPTGVIDISFDNTADPKNPSSAFSSVTKQCSNLYCHGNFTDTWRKDGANMTPTWGTASTGACGNCHDTDNADSTTGTWKATGSHSTHFNSTGRGPGITACTNCHTAETASSHVNGAITFTGSTDKSGTAACDTCHSPGGSYDGVNDLVFGAKANWQSMVYETNTSPDFTGDPNTERFQTGKDKWCAGCHDESPSLISAVNAPRVIGDETVATDFGTTGYGFFKTGHGVKNIPTGLVASGRSVRCTDCHDPSSDHIDANARTYASASNNYAAGFRLKYNMTVPKLDGNLTASYYELCFKCHYDTNRFFNANAMTAPAAGGVSITNYRNGDTSGSLNAHFRHLTFTASNRWDSDLNGTVDSRITCSTCHQVHGSKYRAMIEDGTLSGKSPGLVFRYRNSGGTYVNTLDLLSSFGGGVSAFNNICNNCHGAGGCGPEFGSTCNAPNEYMRTPNSQIIP